MTVSVSVTQPVLTALLAASGPGLLVGFRQGSEVVVASVAYCDLEELAEVEGKLGVVHTIGLCLQACL